MEAPVSQTTSGILPAGILPAGAASALTRPAAGALPETYVEAEPAERCRAKTVHLLGIFGILGAGIYYFLKRGEAGAFARDQMKEAFNFHFFVFVVAVALSIVGSVAGSVIGGLAMVFGLARLALGVCAIVLAVRNSRKAGNGHVARYPARV